MAALVLAGLALGAPGPVRAEPYVAVMGGTAISESKVTESRLSLDGTTVLDGEFHDVDFRNSPLIGAKVGYYLDTPILGGQLGAEIEFYYTEPHASRQTITFVGTSSGAPATFRLSIQHADFEIFTAALNLLYRVPLGVTPQFPYGRVQPYAGLGGGAFISTMHTRTSPLDANRRIHDTDVAPGLQTVGGLKIFLLKRVALFAEYRFIETAEFNFHFKERGTQGGVPVTETARDRSSLTQHQVVGGIALHW
jgi:opacity protein-like surface antigen